MISGVGPHRAETQSTAVSVLMMAQVVYLLLQVPRLSFGSAEGIVLVSLWTFQWLMAAHWWYGAQYYLAHVGPARSLPDVYFFFALLGASWVPALFIHDLRLYLATFSIAFVLAWIRYRTLLPSLPKGSGVREYVRLKAQVEVAGVVLLSWGAGSATVLTDLRHHAVMAAVSVLIQVALITYCVRRLYPLAERPTEDAARPVELAVLQKASGAR